MDDASRPAREWPIPPMDKRSGWKDTAFTWAMGALILQRIADGDTMKAITADPRMPAYCTVFRWMQVVPEFGEAVGQVRTFLAQARQAEHDAQRQAWRTRPRRRRGSRGPSRRGGGSAEALDRLLTRLRDGLSTSEATAEPGAPSFKMLYTRVRGCPGFREAFTDACRWRDMTLALEADRVIDEVRDMTPALREASARYAYLQARRGRLTPKIYRTPARRSLTP
jgi:hypothetical protein